MGSLHNNLCRNCQRFHHPQQRPEFTRVAEMLPDPGDFQDNSGKLELDLSVGTFCCTPSIFRYPVHIQVPRPYSGAPSIFRYPVHIQVPRPYSGAPSIFRYPVHIQVPRPYSGTPSIFRHPVHIQEPVHIQAPRPYSGTPSIFRYPVHIQVPRPYSGTPSIFRYPVHIQVPRPYSGTPSIFRYPVHILRGGGALAVRGCLLPDLRYIPQRGRGRVRLESLFGRP